MQTLLSDIRYAFRMMAKQPGFAVLAILAFALGIGANTAIFSVVNAVLLRPLPYPQPEQLINIRERTPTFPSGSVSYPNFLDWRAAQHSFTDIALFHRESYNVSTPKGGIAPERIGGGRVMFNFLKVLNVAPQLGRDFTEADDVPKGPNGGHASARRTMCSANSSSSIACRTRSSACCPRSCSCRGSRKFTSRSGTSAPNLALSSAIIIQASAPLVD
ncbi:MAG: hypothetical protein DME57_10200 [Verrucomicrobia bacterium]|nr:MAG: hypothetical protein DME57_10200 [Verrucomicrobiota bacterium]